MTASDSKFLRLSDAENLILASASPRRAELLQQAHIPFQVQVADVDECHDRPPRELVLENAFRKANAVAMGQPGRLVLAADTVVALNGRVFGKPKSLREAEQFLTLLSGKCHQVWTGVQLCRFPQCTLAWACETKVFFRSLTQTLIQEYLSLVNPLDKAGAYAIQQHGELIIDHIDGLLSNVIGLPLEEVLKHIRP